jgi:hypothetical protein
VKRDMEVVREILKKISAADGKPDHGILTDGKSEDEIKTILYHVELMEQAGLLTGRALGGIGMDQSFWADLDLTWEGHDFLDAVQDPEVWKETKQGLAEAGSFTFDLAKALAKGFIKKKIEDHTGVKLEF